MARSKHPFVLIAKLQTLKTPKADAIYVAGPMSYTDAILLSQRWQEAGHWVSLRFAEVPPPPPAKEASDE